MDIYEEKMPPSKKAIDDLIRENEKLNSRINYLGRYTQMESLVSAYRHYGLRNRIIEKELKGRISREKRKIRVYYYVYLLDQLCYPIISAIHEDPRFDLRIIAHRPQQVDFLRERGYNAQLIHSLWEEFPDYSLAGQQDFFADICFSEMPYGVLPSLEEAIRPWMISGEWLPKYADVFPRYELNNSLFCLIHYAYFLADEWLWLKSNPDLNVHYGLPYANYSWLYFLESEKHLQFALRRNSLGNTENYVVTGYPKYDAYLQPPNKPESFDWIFPEKARKRIVYAPHFKRSEGTLRRQCENLLQMADTGDFEIIFKPHPVQNTTVSEFAPKFSDHPACQTVRNSDSSQYIFSTADLSIISSVSMHADGLFSGKPYISDLSESNFNHIGREIQSAGYVVEDGTSMDQLVRQILFEGNDPKKTHRDRIRNELKAPGESATKNIINTILSRLRI